MTPTRAVRYARTFGLAVRFFVQLWWLHRLRLLRGPRQAAAASALYTRQAHEFVAFAVSMGGLIVKVGQFLSVRIDLLPKEYIDVLSTLQDALPAVPTEQIRRTIEAELGRRLTAIYATFDDEPTASASLGQVHRATLPDGKPVAVKVLRPGIEALVETDLGILRVLLRLLDRLTGLHRFIDVEGLIEDFTTTFGDELDYVKEGHNIEQFQADLLLNPHVDIPQVFRERSTRRVLTMEYMPGVPVDDLATIDAWGVDRHELAVNLAGLFFEMVLSHGRFHADPHPGNVFVRRDGVIELIDFGMVEKVPATALPHYEALVTSLVRRDAPGIVAALRALGFLGPGADSAKLTELIAPYIDSIVGDVANFYTGGSLVDQAMGGKINLSVDESVLAEIQKFIFTQPIILPGQTTFLGKALITVIGLCLRLDPGLDLLATAAPYVSGPGALWDMAQRALGQGAELVTGIVPTARRVIGLVKRLDDGSFEADMTRALARRVDEAERRQTRVIVRVVAAAVAVILIVFRRR